MKSQELANVSIIMLYLFQLYLSHELHNGQADHPRRTGWYPDIFAALKRLQEWRTDLLSSFNLGKFRTGIGLIFWQSLAPGNRRSPARTVHKPLLVKIVRDRRRGRSQELGTVQLCRRSLAIFYRMILLRLHWFTQSQCAGRGCKKPTAGDSRRVPAICEPTISFSAAEASFYWILDDRWSLSWSVSFDSFAYAHPFIYGNVCWFYSDLDPFVSLCPCLQCTKNASSPSWR